MRAALLAVPFALLAAAPANAQGVPPLPPEMNDPKLAGKLVDALKVLSGAFLDLPVGEAQAALEGRPATATDRARTVRSETRLTKQELDRQLEASKPQMEAGMKALVSALPAMMKGMGEAQEQIERATANMPQPGYPKR